MPTRSHLLLAVGIVLTLAVAPHPPGSSTSDGWPQWRGPGMNGLAAADANPPLRWSERQGVTWKTELPGTGSATPILWGDTLYVQSAEPAGDGRQRFLLLAVDRATGEIRWTRRLHEERPPSDIQANNTWASGSPVTDGERIYAFFGSRGLYALDLEGNLLWERDLGELRTRGGFGEGSSPGLHGDTLLVNWDSEDDSALVALDRASGEERWRVARDEPTTWFTPVTAEIGDRVQVITPGTEAVRGYDLETGELLWSGPGLTLNAIPSPVVVDGVAYLTSGFRGEAMIAVDLTRAEGDLEESGAILWRFDQDTPYVASPLVHGGIVYVLKGLQEILSAVDATTGERLYGPVRLEDLHGVYASPVAAAGRIYVVGRDGNVAVLAAGAEPEILAVNALDDAFDASPVIVGDELYLRGKRFLYRIEEG